MDDFDGYMSPNLKSINRCDDMQHIRRQKFYLAFLIQLKTIVCSTAEDYEALPAIYDNRL